jgi:hypothetical protein
LKSSGRAAFILNAGQPMTLSTSFKMAALKHFNPPAPRLRTVKPKPRTLKEWREDYERAKLLCAANAGDGDAF